MPSLASVLTLAFRARPGPHITVYLGTGQEICQWHLLATVMTLAYGPGGVPQWFLINVVMATRCNVHIVVFSDNGWNIFVSRSQIDSEGSLLVYKPYEITPRVSQRSA